MTTFWIFCVVYLTLLPLTLLFNFCASKVSENTKSAKYEIPSSADVERQKAADRLFNSPKELS